MKDDLYVRLLKKYADALLSVQDKSEDKAFRGGMYCRACKTIHGRCPDAVYGLVVAAKVFGEQKYLSAAQDVFAYGDNLLCKDGGLYNDAQTTWRYTTTFHEIAVCEALSAGKDILDAQTKAAFSERAARMAKWLYDNLDETSPANINYATTNGLALALAGLREGNDAYLQRAKRLLHYAMAHISQSGLLYGESKPHDKLSEKGCRAVDVGYNVEESVPALVKYAAAVGDTDLLDRLTDVVRAHLAFLLPDGGWDNSFGNRNNKWTYWGSRTSDGCAPMFLLLADRDPAFAEAAYRNTELLDKCSPDGFLYGGPHYHAHGEYACTHHTFEHINSIAFAVEHIDAKYRAPARVPVPSDSRDVFAYYPEVRTYKLAVGDWLATVTDYDFDVFFSGHATGGTLTALYDRKTGPVVMASVTDYVLVEPTNMQQVLDRDLHRSLTPRLVCVSGGETYVSSYFRQADMTAQRTQNGARVCVRTGLCSARDVVLQGVRPQIEYILDETGLRIVIADAADASFVLPLIQGNCTVLRGKLTRKEDVFFLTGGFEACEYTVAADNGVIDLKIRNEADA